MELSSQKAKLERLKMGEGGLDWIWGTKKRKEGMPGAQCPALGSHVDGDSTNQAKSAQRLRAAVEAQGLTDKMALRFPEPTHVARPSFPFAFSFQPVPTPHLTQHPFGGIRKCGLCPE